MEILGKQERLIILALVLIALCTLIGLVAYNYFGGTILGIDSSDIVTITGNAPHYVTVEVVPESRIPPVANSSVPLSIEIRAENSLLPIVSITATASNSGSADLGSISSATLPPGLYDVAIKGQSHLTKVFESINFSGPAVRSYDLSATLLKAGDANPTADNYVNGLDLSYLTMRLYTNDNRADLTHDGIVNSLDYTALLKNLYEHGDQ